MAYELRLSGRAQGRIREYVERLGNPDPGSLADAIHGGLRVLAGDPDLGQLLSESFGRPVYRFSIEAADEEGPVRHYLQVAYSVDGAEDAVLILDFGAIPF